MKIVRMNNQGLWSFGNVTRIHEYVPPHLLLLINIVENRLFLTCFFCCKYLKAYGRESQLLDSNFLVYKQHLANMGFLVSYI